MSKIRREFDQRPAGRKDTVAEDLRWVLDTQQGRRFVFWLLDGVCGLHAASYSGGREDTFYREGRRAVGIELMGTAQTYVPGLYRQMLFEALSAKELTDESDKSRKSDEDMNSEEELHG